MEREIDHKRILGQKIRLLRQMGNVTQMDLAKFLGITSSGAISQVESGSKGLTVKNIHRAAEFFGVPAAVLFSPAEMDKDDLIIMQILLDRIKNKKSDKKKARDYKIISKLVHSIEAV